MDLDNIQRKYGLPAPLPVVQNGKFATRFPLNLEHRGDDVFQFGGKYIGEIENIYDLLYKILTNQEIDASLALPYAIKITEDKLYVRDKTNSEWILIFDITKPNFPKEIELYELIYKAITHQVIGEDTSYPGQFKIEENILYVRDKDNLTWTQIGDVTKEFLGATEVTQAILDQVNEILTEVQELKTELNRQIATTNETLTTALQAANEAMTSAQSINIRTFNSVEEMKASNTLKAGALAKTLGFYTAGDGGGADYVITNDIGEDEADEASIITLQGLYAKLLVQDVLNVKQLGAYGDGVHDDTSVLNKAFDILKNIMIEGNADVVGGKYYVAPTLYIPFGIYKVTDTITFYMGANSVKGDGATFLFDSNVENAVEISSVYLFGSSSGDLYHTICTCKIEGLRLICNSPSDRSVDSVGILFGGNANVPKNMLTFENLYITGFKTTLKWGSDTWNVVFIKCSFFGGNINVHFPKNMTNAWERCDFYSCTFCGSKEYAILSEFPYGQINFTNCSFDYHLGVVIRLTYGCRCYLNGCWIEWTVKINKNYIAELIDGENSIFASLFILNTTIVPMYKDSSNINDDEVYEHGLFYSNIRTLTTSENNKVDRLSSIYIENTTMSAFEAPEIITGGGDIQLKNIVGGDFIGFVPKKTKEDVYNLNTIPFIPYGLRTDQTDAYTVNLSEGILSINVINKDEIINKRPIFMLNVKDTEFFTLDLSLKGNKSINFDVIINRGYGYVNPSTGEFVKIFTYKYSPYIRTEINESVSTGAYVNFKTDMWYEEARLTDKCPFPLMVFFEFDFSKSNDNTNGFILSFDKVEIRRRVPL